LLISLLKTEAARPEDATMGALWRSIAGKVDVVRRLLAFGTGLVFVRAEGDPKLDVDVEGGSLLYVGLYCRGVGTHELPSEDIAHTASMFVPSLVTDL